MNYIVETKGLSRDYVLASHTVRAVHDVNLQVEPGTLVAIRGRSGSGKTTLLNLIGGLDQPTAGNVWLDGLDLTATGGTAIEHETGNDLVVNNCTLSNRFDGYQKSTSTVISSPATVMATWMAISVSSKQSLSVISTVS